jgi:hypothetical protein
VIPFLQIDLSLDLDEAEEKSRPWTKIVSAVLGAVRTGQGVNGTDRCRVWDETLNLSVQLKRAKV